MRSNSPGRMPAPIVLSSGVNPSGTGCYSPTLPQDTLSDRSTSTARLVAGQGPELVEETGDRLDSRLVVTQVHELVRGMGMFVRRGEPKQHHRQAENPLERGRDRDRAAFPDVERFGSKGRLERP